MNNKILVVYNLETNLNSHVLASSHSWIEQFSSIYEKVYVFSTHLGRTNLPSNVVTREIGGGNLLKRTTAALNLLKSLSVVAKNRENVEVFHHMSSKTLLLLGLPIKALGVRQIIWYSHSVADYALKLGSSFANVLVSSTENSIPLRNTRNFHAIGHGIDIRNYESINELASISREGLISVGRLVRVKKIEELLRVYPTLQLEAKQKLSRFNLVGPFDSDKQYVEELKTLSKDLEIDVKFLGPVAYLEIPDLIKTYSLFYSGTPKSADKAALEAGISGCVLISTNQSVIELTGMDEIWPDNLYHSRIDLQIDWILRRTDAEMREIRRTIMQKSRELNNLPNLTKEIKKLFNDVA